MRNTHRVTTAVVLTVVLALPAGATSRSSSRSGGVMHAFKRFIVRVASRISPPGHVSLPVPEPTTTTTMPSMPTP